MTPGTPSSDEPGRQCARPCAWLALAPLAGVGVSAALAGADEASSTAETPSEQATISTAPVAVLSRRPSRGVSHSRAAPTR